MRTSRAALLASLLIALAARSAAAQDPGARGAAPLLPEGSELLSARGYFVRSLRDPGLLAFRLEDARRGGTDRTFVALPCDPVDDVEAMLDDPSPSSPIRFEVTATVYRFERRAFILPSAIVPIRMPDPPGMLARVPPPELVPPPSIEDGPPAPRLDAYAAALAEELAASPLASPAAASPVTGPGASAGLDDGYADLLERELEQGIAQSGTGSAAKGPQGHFDRTLLLSPGSRFQDRLASVLRDPLTGAWRARFDTGRPGTGPHDGAESSVELLPSQALEQLARMVRESPVGTAWLLSGEVVVSGERNYLLLTRAARNPVHRFVTP